MVKTVTRLLPYFAVLLCFLLTTIYITHPLIFHLTDYISEIQDAILITWIMNWNIHSFSHHIYSIFSANIYYPYLNTLAYSDTLFISSIIGYIPVKISGEPLIAYNLNLIISFTLLGFCTYLLCYHFIRNHVTSLVSGFITAFSPYTLSKHMHLQNISIWWVPLSLLFIFKYLDNKKFSYLVLAGICFILQLANSILPAYFLVLCYVSICIAINKEISIRIFLNKKAILLYIVIALASIPLLLPYFQVSKEFKYVRDIRDTIHFANRPEYTFYPSDKTRLQQLILSTIYKHDAGPFKYDGYMGIVFFALLVIATIYRYFIYKKNIPTYFDLFFYTGVFTFILSLGPVFQWGGRVIKHPFMIPLPYALFYYLVPGFKGFRNSARWEMLMLILISIAIGIFLHHILRKINNKMSTLISISICILVIAECKIPFKYYPIHTVSHYPAVYKYMSTLPRGAILELPWYNWNMQPYAEVEKIRMYYSLVHFYPRVNGSSGFSPPPWQEKELWFSRNFPNVETINYLKQIKVKYIIVHSAEYDILRKNKFSFANKPITTGKELREKMNTYEGLRLLKVLDNDYVYEIKFYEK